MVTVYPIETLTDITDTFYCDCNPDCIKRISLPPETVKLLMNDKYLILVLDGHTSAKAGAMVAEGAGWKVYRLI